MYTNSDGLRFELYPNEAVDQYIAVEGIYERRFLRFCRTILPLGAAMIDIGANVGNHALYLHDLCSRIDCFEPNPVAAQRLRRNIELNAATNIHVHQVGLGAREAWVDFASNTAGNLGNSGFFEPMSKSGSDYEITSLPIRRADDVVAELGINRVDLVKIDVEGLEEEIFRGLKETIARFRPLVAFEYHGDLTSLESFRSIQASLPGYNFAEVSYGFPSAGALGQVVSVLRYGSRPLLLLVESPEARTYENLLAIPFEHPLTCKIIRPLAKDLG